jgi:hypothetical protein
MCREISIAVPVWILSTSNSTPLPQTIFSVVTPICIRLVDFRYDSTLLD